MTIVYDSRLFTNRKERQIGYKPSPTLRLIDMADISDDEIKNVIKDVSEGETIHINGGLKNDNNFAHKALIMLIKLKKQVISLPQEGFQFNGLKAFVNRLKWFYYINVRYRNIRFFGLTGRNAFHDFLTIKCSIKRIVPFIYTRFSFFTFVDFVFVQQVLGWVELDSIRKPLIIHSLSTNPKVVDCLLFPCK